MGGTSCYSGGHGGKTEGGATSQDNGATANVGVSVCETLQPVKCSKDKKQSKTTFDFLLECHSSIIYIIIDTGQVGFTSGCGTRPGQYPLLQTQVAKLNQGCGPLHGQGPQTGEVWGFVKLKTTASDPSGFLLRTTAIQRRLADLEGQTDAKQQHRALKQHDR